MTEDGRPMFETGTHRFVFAADGKKINAEVYEKTDSGYVRKKTIKDIEKKGLTRTDRLW